VRVFSTLTVSVVLWLIAAPALAQTSSQNTRPPVLSAEAVLLLDAQGRVVFAKNPAESHAPASLVKLMTLYLACEALEAGRAQWEEPVVVSHRVVLTPRYRMGLRSGEAVPLRTLLEGVAIASANDAAAAVAEHLGGTEEAFVAAMNAKAEELGLTHTHYANPHGLPDPNQHTTAEDLAKLIGRLLEDYPASRPLLGGATFVYRGRVYSRNIPLFRDPGGVQALKTGFTREAGYNLAISAWKSDQQFVLIVLGSHTRSLSFRDAKAVLQYGFYETGLAAAPPPSAPPRRPARPAPPRRQRGSRAAAPVAGPG
jgi:D-alanyl-D-alanine carboxypeptidase (penicillin-binding protein 5/6)